MLSKSNPPAVSSERTVELPEFTLFTKTIPITTARSNNVRRNGKFQGQKRYETNCSIF